jgi:hypothetical protein
LDLGLVPVLCVTLLLPLVALLLHRAFLAGCGRAKAKRDAQRERLCERCPKFEWVAQLLPDRSATFKKREYWRTLRALFLFSCKSWLPLHVIAAFHALLACGR